MDADVQRMLADLGAMRRDIVSAPGDERGSRDFFDDPRRQFAAREQAKVRRDKFNAAELAQNEQARRLFAWNSPSSFEADAVAASLADRYSGQAHRANLAQRFGPSAPPPRPPVLREQLKASPGDPRTGVKSAPGVTRYVGQGPGWGARLGDFGLWEEY